LSHQRRLEIVDVVEQKIPSFLLHLSPQVTLTRSSATDFLDHQANIVRSETEVLEKRFATALRTLGKTRSTDTLNTFTRQNTEQIVATLFARLEQLPKVDGKPDLRSLGEPTEIAQRWATEAGLDPHQTLKRMVEHLETASQRKPSERPHS
jgi:hypothetical protein